MPPFHTISSGNRTLGGDKPLFDTEEKEQCKDPKGRVYEDDMDYDPNKGDFPSLEGSLFDDVNFDKFAQQYTEMEEDKLNDLENNPNKPLSDILLDEFSFKTPREDDNEP